MKIFSRWVRAVLSLAELGNKRGRFPGQDTIVTAVLTEYHVKTSFHNQFILLLSAYVFSALKTTGNIMAKAYHEQGDSSIVWLIERWAGMDKYNEYCKCSTAEAIRAFTETGGALLKEVFWIEELECYVREQKKVSSAAAEQPMTVMLLIEVRKGCEMQFRRMNHAAMPAIREEQGVLTFLFSQVISHKTRFVVYKQFDSREALQYHLKSAAIAPVIRFLQTSVKEPPFEKAYHHLVEFVPLQPGGGNSDAPADTSL